MVGIKKIWSSPSVKSGFKRVILVFPLFLLIFPIVDFSGASIDVFPGHSGDNHIGVAADEYWHGASTIEEFTFDKHSLVLRFILREGAASPLVFLSFTLGSAAKPLDLSAYSSLSLRIRNTTLKKVLLFVKTFEPGVSSPDPVNSWTLRHNEYWLPLVPGKRDYRIGLDQFITPKWWTEKLDEPALNGETFTMAMALDMQFNRPGTGNTLNQVQSIIIDRISFSRPLSPLSWILCGCAILVYLFLAGWLLGGRDRGGDRRELPSQKPLKLSPYRERDLRRIVEFLESHYHNTEISTRMLSEELGIPRERVFRLLKEEYNLTFKQLINEMRIKEAKRLLEETDIRIIDIALQIGFNSVSYFNQLFKKHEGQPPSDYRKHH